ncbi:MAG: ATP phosphoribosyltransferase [Candidatus Bathyarchaeia archaeon]
MNRKIRMAIPSKGRLHGPSIDLMAKAGVEIYRDGRSYLSETSDPSLEVIFVRAKDVPLYLHYGAADIGITGRDLIVERGVELYELLSLPYGECKLVVAVPEGSDIRSIEDVKPGSIVATSHPRTVGRFFEGLNKDVKVLELDGSIELAPRLGLADLIADISSSGETLKRNGLRVICSILESTAKLACNKISYRAFEDCIDGLLRRIEATMRRGRP